MSGMPAALRIAIGTLLMLAWSLGITTAYDGWPDRPADWWVIYLAGFVVLGVLWYVVEKLVVGRRGRS